MTTYNSVNDRRGKNWLKNALSYRFARILKLKRDNNIWVFSAWEGQKYCDNAKYLFEYVREQHPEIKCYWQTRNEKVFNDLQKQGIPVQLLNSIESIRTQRKAGVAVYTNGLDDFGDFPKIYGAKLISLWHGVCFKKGYRLLIPEAKSIRARLGNLKWDFFNWVKRDITIATSEYNKNQYMKGVRIKDSSSILICGQPRNDVFALHCEKSSVIENEDIIRLIGGKRIILYMPTFRKDNSTLLRNVSALVQDVRLRECLSKINSILVCKLHYLCRGDFPSDESFIFLNDDDVRDVQKLMCCADAMVTDYSSSIVDYALLRKPVLYYFPDKEEYDIDGTMMPETMEACSVNCAETHDEFIIKIGHIFDLGGPAYKQCDILNEYFDGTNVSVGEYSKTTFAAIIHALQQ